MTAIRKGKNSMSTRRAPKRPTMSSVARWKYEAVPSGTGAFVSGPSISDSVYANNSEDAEMIAAALNFATNFDAIKKHALRLESELEFLTEFK